MTVLAVVGVALLWFLWYLVAEAVADLLRAWIGRVTGLSAWARRVHWHDRVLVRTGAYSTAVLAVLGAIVVGVFGVAMLVAPPAPYDRDTGLAILAVACTLGAVGAVGALFGVRWWRASSCAVAAGTPRPGTAR